MAATALEVLCVGEMVRPDLVKWLKSDLISLGVSTVADGSPADDTVAGDSVGILSGVIRASATEGVAMGSCCVGCWGIGDSLMGFSCVC